jgi:hypothetical protein
MLRKVFAVAAPVTALFVIFFAFWMITGQALPCMFHFYTGLFCPGCGSGRMILSILQLDFYQAFRYNPVVFSMLPIFSVIFIIHLSAYLRGKKIAISKPEKVILIFLVVVLIIYGIARNIPAFSCLAPTSAS